MIETNRAIDFIGEVTILAEMPRTSVTIEAVTECTVIYISPKGCRNMDPKRSAYSPADGQKNCL